MWKQLAAQLRSPQLGLRSVHHLAAPLQASQGVPGVPGRGRMAPTLAHEIALCTLELLCLGYHFSLDLYLNCYLHTNSIAQAGWLF